MQTISDLPIRLMLVYPGSTQETEVGLAYLACHMLKSIG